MIFSFILTSKTRNASGKTPAGEKVPRAKKGERTEKDKCGDSIHSLV
jgi:hypothetical protein